MQPAPLARRYLAVDIGNSGFRLTELDVGHRRLGATRRITWRFSRDSLQNKSTEKSEITSVFQPDEACWLKEIDDYLDGSPSVWMISSVRSDALSILHNALRSRTKHVVRIVQHTDVPLIVNVDRPDRVGIDRLLAALAATALSDERPLIVIEAGSAVTVDLVGSGLKNSNRIDSFEGGAIIPGVPMIIRLLGQGADQLPELHVGEFSDSLPLPGKNTEQAMLCGAASALLGGVLHVVERYRQQYGRQVPVIISGGDGLRIATHIPEPRVVEHQLVQMGLLMLAGESSR